MNVVEIVLLIGVLGLSIVGARKTYDDLREKREAKRRRRQGAKNHERAELRAEEYCAGCSRSVNPDADLYDKRHKHWWHKRCLDEAIR